MQFLWLTGVNFWHCFYVSVYQIIILLYISVHLSSLSLRRINVCSKTTYSPVTKQAIITSYLGYSAFVPLLVQHHELYTACQQFDWHWPLTAADFCPKWHSLTKLNQHMNEEFFFTHEHNISTQSKNSQFCHWLKLLFCLLLYNFNCNVDATTCHRRQHWQKHSKYDGAVVVQSEAFLRSICVKVNSQFIHKTKKHTASIIITLITLWSLQNFCNTFHPLLKILQLDNHTHVVFVPKLDRIWWSLITKLSK